MKFHKTIGLLVLVLLASAFSAGAAVNDYMDWCVTHNDGNYSATELYDVGNLTTNFTETSVTTGIAGKMDEASRYDGSTSVHSAGNVWEKVSGDEITINCWIKPDTLGVPNPVVGKKYNYDFGLEDTNKLQFIYYPGTNQKYKSDSLTLFETGSWHMITATYTFGTGSSIKLYYNGTEVAGSWTNGDGNAAPPSNSNPLMISPSSSYHGSFFDGDIDDCGMWSDTLTDAEILELYDGGTGQACPYETALATVANKTLAPNPLFVNYDLNCSWDFVNSTGGAGEDHSNVSWYVNGTNVYNDTDKQGSSVLDSANYSAKDTVTCQITPDDQAAPGAATNTSTLTVQLLNQTKHIFSTPVLEETMQDFNLTTIVDPTYVTGASAIFEFNYTNYTATATNTSGSWTFNTTLQMPDLSVNNLSLSWYYYLNFTTVDGMKDYNHTNSTTILRFAIDDCSSYNFPILEYLYLDEENKTAINGSLDAFFNVTVGTAQATYAYNHSNRHNHTICAENSTFSGTIDGTLFYGATNYGSRTYQFEDLTYTSGGLVSTNLYLLASSDLSSITNTIYDEFGNELEGYELRLLRYYVDTNTYILVDQGLTNFEGQIVLKAELNNPFYKFRILNPAGSVLKTSSATQIYDTSLVHFVTLGEDIGVTLDNLLNLTHSLTFLNDSDQFKFTWDHPSNIVTSAFLKVYTVSALGNTLYNTTTASSSSGTIYAGVAPVNGTTYLGVATVQFAGDANETHVDSLTYEYSSIVGTFGKFGLFMSALIILAFALIGLAMREPAAVAIFVPLGVTITRVIKFHALSYTWVTGIWAIALIILYIIRDKA